MNRNEIIKLNSALWLFSIHASVRRYIDSNVSRDNQRLGFMLHWITRDFIQWGSLHSLHIHTRTHTRLHSINQSERHSLYQLVCALNDKAMNLNEEEESLITYTYNGFYLINKYKRQRKKGEQKWELENNPWLSISCISLLKWNTKRTRKQMPAENLRKKGGKHG